MITIKKLMQFRCVERCANKKLLALSMACLITTKANANLVNDNDFFGKNWNQKKVLNCAEMEWYNFM